MVLLVAVIVVTVVAGLRREGRTIPMRATHFVVVCALVGAAYFGQRVI